MDKLFQDYLQMLGRQEVPVVFHRWSFLTILGAWLGNQFYLEFGNKPINCNMYVMLMGGAGSRKTTAINIAVDFLKLCGYDKIAATKTSKEKFLVALAGGVDSANIVNKDDDILERNLFGDMPASSQPCEILIAAEEFNIFVGNGNIEFLSTLGALWDYRGKFNSDYMNAKSASIYNPVVSILAGNTPSNFSLAFPVEAIGQGIFSRLILVAGERSENRYTIPDKNDLKIQAQLIQQFNRIKEVVVGGAKLTNEAYDLLDTIYKKFKGIQDARFDSYNNRRLTHLIKLCLLTAAMNLSTEITKDTVLYANTLLTYVEAFMPKAIGEFGRAKNSSVSDNIMTILTNAHPPIVSFQSLWKSVHTDLDTPEQLRNILTGLKFAGKISVEESGGFYANMTALHKEMENVDFSFLSKEEQKKLL